MTPEARELAEVIEALRFIRRVVKTRGPTLEEMLGELQHNPEAVATLDTLVRYAEPDRTRN